MRKEEIVTVDLFARAVPAKHSDEGLRALSLESTVHPEAVPEELWKYHVGNMENPCMFTSLSLPRISSIIFPCSRQMDKRMVSIRKIPLLLAPCLTFNPKAPIIERP